MNNFQQNLIKLPKDVQGYLTSMKATELNILICERNAIQKEDVSKYMDLINSLFFREIRIVAIVKKAKELFGFDEESAKKLAKDIAGIRLLVIDDWIDDNVAKYIEELGGTTLEFLKYINEQKQALIEEKEYFESELKDEYEPYVVEVKKDKLEYKEMNKKVEMNDSLDLFENDLFLILKNSDEQYFSAYNDILIMLFAENAEFLNNMQRTLLVNEEKLTKKKFILNGKPVRPTIEYWIKDFIANQGSGMFSNIDLSKYITNSENVKRLDDKEKRLVKKVLRLYRNLIFFPDSLKDLPPDRWEIFPLDRQGGDFEKLRKQPLGAPKSVDEKELDKLEKMEKGYKPNSLEKLALDEEIEKRKQIEELRYRLSKYREGSLERKVLEEEILKLES